MITIIDYSVNNIWSVQSALDYLDVKYIITNDPNTISEASHIILPGVGSFNQAMNNIKALGIDEAIHNAHKKNSKILGICLGMHLLATKGLEYGETDGLNLISNTIRLFDKTKMANLKIPHIGFNSVEKSDKGKLFYDLNNLSDFYFVHSYIMTIEKLPKNTIIHKCKYGEEFVAAFEYLNIYGTQFHPEKSQINGLNLLKNFANLQC
jgi:glutamine amidotransferase